MAQLGVENFRITGGEPLVRKGCVPFVKSLKAIPGAKNVTLTTNGISHNYIHDLANAGLDGLNISLDSVVREKYKQITGVDALGDVWQSINKAIKYGIPVKINAVIIKDINHCEILPLAAIAEKLPVSVRFIELMPTIVNTGLVGISNADVLQILSTKYEDLTHDNTYYGHGPARYYNSKSLLGKLGFISPLNHNFCQNCNRLRISSTGFLRLCLHHNQGVDLRSILRNGYTNEQIKSAIVAGVRNKPLQHLLESETNLQDMSKVGG